MEGEMLRVLQLLKLSPLVALSVVLKAAAVSVPLADICHIEK